MAWVPRAIGVAWVAGATGTLGPSSLGGLGALWSSDLGVAGTTAVVNDTTGGACKLHGSKNCLSTMANYACTQASTKKITESHSIKYTVQRPGYV